MDGLCPGGLPGVESVLEFPYDDKFSRYKLFPPLKRANGKEQKYLQPAGTGCHLYTLDLIRPILGDPTVPLHVFEGEKKTALGVQCRKMAIGVSGVWSWVSSETGNGIADLDGIAWPDRKVEVVFDSDVWTRPDLQQALYAFMKELSGRGADVSAVVIPGKGDDKIGFDDYVVANSIEAFDKLTRVNLKHAALSRHSEWWKGWKAKRQKDAREISKLGLQLENVEPWPDAVDGAVLLNNIRDAIRRFVVASPEAIVTESLWVLFAHAVDAFGISPMLAFSSPVRQCGKSVSQAIVGKLVPKPLTTSNISAPALFRAVEKFSPTLIVDECDSAFVNNPELRELVNASHLRSQAFVCRTVGDNHEPMLFRTWCAKCLALIGNLPDTTASRSVVVRMQRKTRKDRVERFSALKDYSELKVLAQKAARWVADNIVALREADPVDLPDMGDRDLDNWIPLIAIADLAGAEWPKLARDAAARLSGETAEEPKAVDLLKDIKAIFDGDPESDSDDGCQKISSEAIVESLNNKEGRPWADYNHGKGITKNQVARMLKGFDIPSPRNMRLDDKILKGYQVEWFSSAFERYLSPPFISTTFETLHPLQLNENEDLGQIFQPLQGASVADRKSELSPRQQRNVADVAVQNSQKEALAIFSGNGDGQGANGEQKEETSDEFWTRVKAEHTAKRAAGK
jgi:putative DNA primase/helicase